jgi:heme oxygenase
MLRLMSADYSASEYVAHLGRLLGFYDPFERALAHSDAGPQHAFSTSKSQLLRRDLAECGLTVREIRDLPRCAALPPPDRRGTLGWLYVSQGSALGGQIISRRLAQSLGPARRFAFYHADAALTAQEWNAFCLHLKSAEGVSTDAVCAAAVAVFDTFATWFESQPLALGCAGTPQ